MIYKSFMHQITQGHSPLGFGGKRLIRKIYQLLTDLGLLCVSHNTQPVH